MKKMFLDTNIILDVMAQREPFNVAANAVFKLGIKKVVELCVTPLTFANCVYILKSSYKQANPVSIVKAYKLFITVIPMDGQQCERALNSDGVDFEDMLQYESAVAANCNCIITRNKKHFPKDFIPVMTAEEFLKEEQ